MELLEGVEQEEGSWLGYLSQSNIAPRRRRQFQLLSHAGDSTISSTLPISKFAAVIYIPLVKEVERSTFPEPNRRIWPHEKIWHPSFIYFLGTASRNASEHLSMDKLSDDQLLETEG